MPSFKLARLEPLVPFDKNLEGRISLAPRWLTRPSILVGTHEIYSQFKNLTYFGKLPTGSNLKSKQPYHRKKSIFNVHLGGVENSLYDIAGDKFYLAVPTLENVEFSISTFDARPPVNYKDVFHSNALKFLDMQYGPVCRNTLSSTEEIAEYIDYTKSCGYPGNFFGFRNKKELSECVEFQTFLMTNQHLKTRPIWSVCPKEEFKDIEDLKALKIRLFTIPPYDLLYEQLRFGKKISENLKQYKWSAYGFNPYAGGAHRLAIKLLTKRIRLFYDVSGWDKFFPLLGEIFDFIRSNHNIPDDLKHNFEWMCQNTADFLFKTPHGFVFEKNYGNPSGSGTTTRDNILGHVIIIASALIECYFLKYGSYPTHQLLNQQIIALFGDDSIISLDEEFDFILKEDYLKNHMAKYGLKLKFLYGGLDYSIEKMQFLGFTFHKIGDNYYPRYDIQRLCSSILFENGRNSSREAYTSRLFIIMIMSYPTDHFYEVNLAFRNWCSHLNSLNVTLSPTEVSFVAMESISVETIQQLYLGWESSAIRDDLFFFASQWLEEAIKDGAPRL